MVILLAGSVVWLSIRQQASFDEPSGFPTIKGPKLTDDTTPTIDGTGEAST